MANMRRGLGKGMGVGYKNIAPMDSHIHALSAKGVKSVESMARNVIGDGKFPNKYFVSVGDDYHYFNEKTGTMEWVNDRDGVKGKYKTLKVFDSYEEAKKYADSLDLKGSVDDIAINNVTIEDRLSGQLFERYLVEEKKVTFEQEEHEDLGFTKEKMAKHGQVFHAKKMNLHAEAIGLKPTDTITILGRRWFDKVNGNTYHSTTVYKNGEVIGEVPFQYGYDDAYKQTGYKILLEKGVFSKTGESLKSGAKRDEYDIEMYYRDHRNQFVFDVVDVARRKDL